jgi:H+/Cl- antiporter ClcA
MYEMYVHSGCSLGPEGPSVEIGAGISRMASGGAASLREKHHLFLAGTAAGVSAGNRSIY